MRALTGLAALAAGLALGGMAAAGVGAPAPTGAPPGEAVAERPRARVDTAYPALAGRTHAVAAGGSLQAALEAAQPGDTVTLEAGATFRGPFVLPAKPGSGWIIVRTSAPEGLPPAGHRIDPARSAALPKLEASAGSVLVAAPGAHHYRFVGLEIRPAPGTFLTNLVQLGASERSLEALPHHIIFDRCYLHGDPRKGGRRGIAMNSRDTAVVDSYLSDFKEIGADSQAILGWNGPGPFRIVNNYIEAAGENVMFGGGADPAIPDLVPSDIEVRRNLVTKPLAWKASDPAYGGVSWSVKNLFELKNARRVWIEGNVFERNWVHAQPGFAIVLTVRNERGSAPWSVVEDVTFVNNVVRHTASAVNILGRDDNQPSRQTRRILIRNNLFVDVGGPRWGGGGRLFQLLRGTADVVIEHNTALQTDHIVLADGEAHTGFVFRDNIVPHNETGVFGSGERPGLATLRRYFPGAVFARNVIVGTWPAAQYPPDNLAAPSIAAVGFANPAAGDYRLAASSPYRNAATDGTDIGVNVTALAAAMAPASP